MSSEISPERIEVQCVSHCIGAEVSGVDLAEPLTDARRDTIRSALLEHKVLFFRGQTLSPAQLASFGKCFGDLSDDPRGHGTGGEPAVMALVREAAGGRRTSGESRWHADATFRLEPDLGSVLYAIDVPASGGDALWANMESAYETLPDDIKHTIDGLRAVHSAIPPMAQMQGVRPPPELGPETEAVHPVVRTHPETGRKCLFVNANFTRRFDGWTFEQSMPLLSRLWEHAAHPDFFCRLQWQKGSLVVWDNRCTQHRVMEHGPGTRVEMHRVVIRGDRPR